MESCTLARVILMPDEQVHIAYMNRQTYYCTPEALLFLLSEPFHFANNNQRHLAASTYLVNKKQAAVDEIPGLTLLTICSDKRIVCDFPILFHVLSMATAHPEGMNKNLIISRSLVESQDVDGKSILLLMFLEFTKNGGTNTGSKKLLNVDAETQTRVLKEIVNTSMNRSDNRSRYHLPEQTEIKEEVTVNHAVQERDVPEDASASTRTSTADAQETKCYVTIKEYAKIHNRNEGTISNWINRGKLKSARKNERNQWVIDINDSTTDGRAGRHVEPMNDGSNRKVSRLKGKDYKSVQVYIKERRLVTEKVRPYIRTAEEIRYYERKSYHEVLWETGSAMIIDINPDYYSKKHGMTNRELIKSEKSPVVPGNEDCEFHLHHIGQRKDSPLAIIPKNDHNSKELYSFFHRGKTEPEDLHDAEFEAQKIRFWNNYIEMYDKYETYRKIPFLNSKHKRKDK